MQTAHQLIEWLRVYAQESINSRLMDERRCLSPGVILDFGNKGLLGMQVPEQYGGLGLGHRAMLQIIEQLGAIDPTLALFVGLNNVLGVRPILHYAKAALKEQLLPKLATGRELAAFAITEASAGSHPFGILAKAKPVGQGWQLQGEKIWSGSAAWAGVINVFVQQIDASGQPIGISGFAVQKGTAGLRQGPEALTMGMRGMVQNTVVLDQVQVDETQVLGEVGHGMAIAQDAMMYGRLAIAAASVGGMKRCAQLMLRYSKRRKVSTGRLLDNPVTLTRLTWLTNAIAAVESLVTLAANRLDSHLPVPEEIFAACKITGPEFYWQAADHLMQCLGGRGYIETNLAPQIMRDARVLRIFEGPTESLAMYLGARILNQGADLKTFLQELETPEIGESLFAAADLILAHYLSEKSPFSEALTARRQANFAIGNIAGWAILLAALKASSAPSGAIAWGQHSFDQAVTQALQTNPNEGAVCGAIALSEQVEPYQQSIGDIEQTLPGADDTADELLAIGPLAKHAVEPSTGHLAPLNSTDPHAKTDHAQTDHAWIDKFQKDQQSTAKQERTLIDWMSQWLSAQLAVAANSIDPAKAFAEYGLDSVLAVELAQDLSVFLGLQEPLEVTLAWNFPTIQALASHLASRRLTGHLDSLANQSDTPRIYQSEKQSEKQAEKQSEKQAEKSVVKKNSSPKINTSFENLSDAEVVDALAAELSTVRRK